MTKKKSIFIINGSASRNSSNEKLIHYVVGLLQEEVTAMICSDLKTLPHFDPELTTDNPPAPVLQFRECISHADGIVVCTPEYIFSIPAGLKNALEWCVSTAVFSGKPAGLITASASGQKGHDELQLIMKTLMTVFSDETTLLIQGIKGKVNEKGDITDEKTRQQLMSFAKAYRARLG